MRMTIRFVAGLAVPFAIACGGGGKPQPTAPTPPTTPVADARTESIATSQGALEIRPIYHATVLFTFAGKHLYLDPWSKGDFTNLPKADAIFITDIHPDHLDADAIAKLRTPQTILVAPPAVAEKLQGVSVVLKNGDAQDVLGVHVEAIPMYNLQRGPEPGKLFHDKGRGDGFVFTFGDKRVYVSGDTECTDEMKALKNIDVAFVCMNLPYTMPPSEAATCINAFKPKVLYPYHYRDSNLDELSTAIDKSAGIDVRIRNWY